MYSTVPRGIGICAVVAGLTLGGTAFAEIITVQDASFDNVVLADGAKTASVPDWYTSSAYAINPTAVSLPNGPSHGDNVGYIYGQGVMSQVLDTTITGNTRYELNVDITARTEYSAGEWFVGLYAYNGINTLMDSAANLFELTEGGDWQTTTIVFDVAEGSPLIGQNLKLRLVNTLAGSTTVFFDNIHLTATAMPAPGALALLGLAGLVGRRRRQR